MKVLVCDDEQLARDRVSRLINDMEGYSVVAQASNGVEAIEQLANSEVDIALLDVRMPVMDGLEAAQHISKLPVPPAIIFCTAYDSHALDAFKVNAIDYLVKPVRSEDLESSLQKARSVNRAQLNRLSLDDPESGEESGNRRTHISAKSYRGIELIPVSEIRYFMADQKYVTVKYDKGEILIDETLKDLENEFGEQFIRIHRNALIAKRFLEGMEQVSAGHYQVRLQDTDERLTVSRRHVAGLRKIMQHM